jgi:hypothetical protein
MPIPHKPRLGDLDAVEEGGSVRVLTLPFCLPPPLSCILVVSDLHLSFLPLLVLGFPVDSLRMYSFELPLIILAPQPSNQGF